MKNQTEIYKLIYKTVMTELTTIMSKDAASRLANKYAVKNTRDAFLTQPDPCVNS